MSIDALTNQLLMLSRSRRFGELVSYYEANAAVLTGAPVASRVVAAALAELGQLDRALKALMPAAQAPAADLATLLLCGRISLDSGNAVQALALLRRALQIEPNHAEVWRWLGEAALATGQPELALASAATHRLRFHDDVRLADLHVRLLVRAARPDEALLEFERILARWPNHPELGPAYASFVTFEFPLQSAEWLERIPWRPLAGELSPSLVRGTLALPALYDSNESVVHSHQRVLAELQRLTELAKRSTLRGDKRADCLDAHMFFIAYAEQDVTAVLFAWGDFVEALCAPLRLELKRVDSQAEPPIEPRPGAPIRRVGFVTNRVGGSSAGRVFGRWIDEAVRIGLDVHVFALGAPDPADDSLARKTFFQRFEHEHVRSWRSVSNAILDSQCDLLIYPECQGSALQQLLAGIKLAPLQAAGFGNPVSTGLRSMDYFLSPVEAEPAFAKLHYREQLVTLSGTWSGISPPPAASSWPRSAFGLADDAHVYLITQPMPKWTPSFRAAVRQLLLTDDHAQLVIVQWSLAFSFRAFELMLRTEFAASGLSYADRVTVCGWLSHPDYLSLHNVADVVLDTFGFSGGVSTVDALACGRPVVTLRGTFLRGRQSAALIERSGSPENVVESPEAFVSRAIAAARAQHSDDSSLLDQTSISRGDRSDDVDGGDFADWLRRVPQNVT